jgi:hypothetical protein
MITPRILVPVDVFASASARMIAMAISAASPAAT